MASASASSATSSRPITARWRCSAARSAACWCRYGCRCRPRIRRRRATSTPEGAEAGECVEGIPVRQAGCRAAAGAARRGRSARCIRWHIRAAEALLHLGHEGLDLGAVAHVGLRDQSLHSGFSELLAQGLHLLWLDFRHGKPDTQRAIGLDSGVADTGTTAPAPQLQHRYARR